MGHDEIACAGIEAVGIAEEFANGVVGEMAGAGEDALFDDPGIGADLEHVEVVIGFEDEAIGVAEMDANVIGHEAEVGADGDLVAVGAESEADGVDGIVGNAEGVDVNVADGEGLATFDGFNAMEALAESFGEDAAEGAHGGFGDIERSFPEAENLREAGAVVGVLVGDEDGVEVVELFFDSGEAGEGFALAEARVNEDTGAIGFEQGEVARTAGSEDGDAKADEKNSCAARRRETKKLKK